MDGRKNDQNDEKNNQTEGTKNEGSAGGQSSREYQNPDVDQESQITNDENELEE